MEYSLELIRNLKEKNNLIRQESIQMCCTAESGHPGGSLSEADILATLYFHFMNIDPCDLKLKNRDRLLV